MGCFLVPAVSFFRTGGCVHVSDVSHPTACRASSLAYACLCLGLRARNMKVPELRTSRYIRWFRCRCLFVACTMRSASCDSAPKIDFIPTNEGLETTPCINRLSNKISSAPTGSTTHDVSGSSFASKC